jgi:hypothetical protein
MRLAAATAGLLLRLLVELHAPRAQRCVHQPWCLQDFQHQLLKRLANCDTRKATRRICRAPQSGCNVRTAAPDVNLVSHTAFCQSLACSRCLYQPPLAAAATACGHMLAHTDACDSPAAAPQTCLLTVIKRTCRHSTAHMSAHTYTCDSPAAVRAVRHACCEPPSAPATLVFADVSTYKQPIRRAKSCPWLVLTWRSDSCT